MELEECPYDCVDGHLRSCECSEPAFDIGDLICRPACAGCCPNGCRPGPMKEDEAEAGRRARRLLGG